ncbi:MAG: phosphatidate cytidylyltransferase [Yaniella sp.]|uniref:phosphatidate cytidylyltransferase n=1 Tax=Yaniella sp. TaxID=2773929 RepID=UPI0026493FD4|nr:phosphatidate cytidylyltransferase [Yaniella sp.]MDN5732055.1 phosphatidate cytidylyltransferase [Yaniella sp.]MDN5743040.1 phosphatidate cytidylyltransferase [Yaniella sp.]MDN5815866.1 phosphatidate cytidylyltransferase [Yaniella sp.]MDN5818466.1 phosphatidate cytidylyltransferase [Yaniella sp.]MDN5838580.1 phosphatidate cytidylyltransferase [Yaniella sp.]
MIGLIDSTMLTLFIGIGGILVLATVIAAILGFAKRGQENSTLKNLNQRIAAWWAMALGLAITLLIGETAVIILFLGLSFLALREFLTIAPTHRSDHKTLVWLVYIIPVINYWFLWEHWYGAFAVLIPVYAFLFLPIRNALAGDTDNFLQRAAMIQWALMVCVYAISYIPAIMQLPVMMHNGREAAEGSALGGGGAEGALLMLFLVVVVQLSDVFQYVWGKTLGKHPVAPSVSPNKTWEGLIGGVLTATAIGAGLWWITPFVWWQAALLAFVSCLMGFFGGLVMSSIKRDRGVKDFGATIAGHGGIMDRLDSLSFSAPVFFHLVRFFFTT